jgi:hypothetical protein
MQVPADYLAVRLNIQNDSKDPIKRADEIENAFRVITEKLKQNPGLAVKPSVVSLAPREQSKSFISSYNSDEGSSAQLYVLASLKPQTNVFEAAKRIYQVITAIPLNEGTKVTLGNTVLGLDDPEKNRAKLLGLISKSVTDTKKYLGLGGTVEIEGLESPVTVMQLNEKEVLLFINYRLRIQSKTQ